MPQMLIEQRCAEALARQAGQTMLRASRRGFSVSTKGDHDVVTNIDRDIESFVVDQLQDMFPDDDILGEEFGGQQAPTDRRHWLIDPIDGTLNFSCGVPLSCVSIALRCDGQSQVGVIYDPYRDELFSARRNGGAALNGEAIEVSATSTLDEAVLVTGFRPIARDDITDNLQNFAAVSKHSRGVRRLGSAALDLAYVAAGRMDGFWEFGLNPWDTAAGYLLVAEAGGKVTDVHAGPYNGFEPSIVAANDLIHGQLIDLVRS